MSEGGNTERAIAEGLRLRSAKTPVVRLSRGALVLMVSVAGVGVAGAVAFGLATHPARAQASQDYTVGGPPSSAVANLPKDYAAPKLGPPLPGDLGRPIVGTPPPAPVAAPAGAAQPPADVQQAQQRAVQEVDQARTSRLFASDVHGATVPLAAASLQTIADAVGEGTGFLNGRADRQTTSPDRLVSPPSPYVVQAGAVIPAALVTGIRSDMPGQIIGQVTENIFDSPTGRFLLIPQGSKLLGSYDSQMTAGQSRILLAWTRLILPNGRSLRLEKLPGGDAEGYGGLQDKVNHHWGTIAGAAALSTLLGVGVELGANNTDSDIVSALRFGEASSMNQAGQQIVGRALTIPPTLTIRPGAPVRVMVNRDLVLEPYQS